MKEILTKDNITFALAVFGSLGTILSWIYASISNRKNIYVRISRAYLHDNSVLLHILMDNKSRLPISINRVSLIINETTYHAFDIKTQIFRGDYKSNNEIIKTDIIYSAEFPIELASLGGTNFYLFFELPPNAFQSLSTQLTLQFHTNRGMVRKRKLSFQTVDSPAEMC